MPSIVSTISTTNKFHTIIKPSGGPMAGIYNAHINNENLRIITKHASYPYNKSFATNAEAI
jgi:hypothetical protein